MSKPVLIDHETIDQALGEGPWARDGDTILLTHEFSSFSEGIAFVDQVALLADEQDHHPDIDIRYTNVTLRVSTHESGGLTKRDLKLASSVTALL